MSTAPESGYVSTSLNGKTADVPQAVDDTVRVIVATVAGELVVVEVPGTSYRLRLTSPDTEALRSRIGRPVRGRIAGRALRMHVASAGGRFIEPADGVPRIVQGSVRSVERSPTGDIVRVLVEMAVPVWVAPMPDQCFRDMALGDLVNFYMESGTTFTLAG